MSIIDVFSCSNHTYEDAIRRGNYYYFGAAVQPSNAPVEKYVGPVVNGKLHLSPAPGRHVVVSVSDPRLETTVEGDGKIPASSVYGLLRMGKGEALPYTTA